MTFMRTIIFIMASAISLSAQEIQVEDLYLVEDSSQAQPSGQQLRRDLEMTAPKLNSQASDSSKKRLASPFADISASYTWHKYDVPWDFYSYSYSYRFGYSLSGGIAIDLKQPFRFRTGFRISQTGNRLIVTKFGFWQHDYDTTTGERIDSQYVSIKGGDTKLTQYYASLPVMLDIYLKSIPVYVFNGIEPSILLWAYSTDHIIINDKVYKNKSVDDRDRYRPVNWVINHGIGIHIEFPKHFSSEIQIAFSWGAFQINEPDNWFINLKTREFSARYLMLFDKKKQTNG